MMKMGHIERKQREKEEMKQRILEAAKKIAFKEGWHSVTIRKIAEEIEYTPPIVYEHFENKEDLIKEIIYSGFDQQHKEFSNLVQTETDPKKLLKTISLKHWDFAFNNTELYRLMFSLERPAESEEMLSNFRAIEKMFFELTKDEKMVRDIILQWMCMMNGAVSVVMKLSYFPTHEKEDPREVFIKMMDQFIDRF